MTNRPGDRHVLHPGDKVNKIGDYTIPGLILCRFTMSNGAVRYAVEHKAEGGGRFVHIYADKNLELVERGFDGRREDDAIELARREAFEEAAKIADAERETAKAIASAGVSSALIAATTARDIADSLRRSFLDEHGYVRKAEPFEKEEVAP